MSSVKTDTAREWNVIIIYLFCFSNFPSFNAFDETCFNANNTVYVTSSDMMEAVIYTNDKNLNNSSTCWILDTGSENLLLLLFLTYNITCQTDGINIYDGKDDNETALARDLCGAQSDSASFSTSQRYALVHFKEREGNGQSVFKIHAIAAKDYSGTGCKTTQVVISADAYQFLSSPNFPDKYLSNSNCRWTLINPTGKLHIQAIVSDIEDGDSSSCFDSYMIYDGPNKCDNNNITSICSEYPHTLPFNVTSSDSTITITFHSDGSVNKRGFLIRFKSMNAETVTTLKSTTNLTTTTFRVWNNNSTLNKLISASDIHQLKRRVRVEFGLPTFCRIRLFQNMEISDSKNFQELTTDYISLQFIEEDEENLTSSSNQSAVVQVCMNKCQAGHLYSDDETLSSNVLIGIITGTLVFIFSVVGIVICLIKKIKRTKSVSNTKVKPFLQKIQRKSLDWITVKRHNDVIPENRGTYQPRTYGRKLSMW